MQLSSKQTRYLRSLAHHLNPMVAIGKQGLTPALYKEVDRNLADHELIKIRVLADDKAALKVAAEEIKTATASAVIQVIGRIVVLYRPGEEPEIKLPN